MTTFTEQKKKEAEHYDLNHPITKAYVLYRAGLEDEIPSKSSFINAVEPLLNKKIKDTLQLLLDSEEMQKLPEVPLGSLFLEKGLVTDGYNQAITAIRAKIKSLME